MLIKGLVALFLPGVCKNALPSACIATPDAQPQQQGRLTRSAATEASRTSSLASRRPCQMASMKARTCTLNTAGAFSASSRAISAAA